MVVYDEVVSFGKLMFGVIFIWLKVCGLFWDYCLNICFGIFVMIFSGDQFKEVNVDYRFKIKFDVVKRKDYLIFFYYICF